MEDYCYYVYALLDPDNYSIKYVGCSANPSLRLKVHIRDIRGTSKRCKWLKGLFLLNKKPEMALLGVYDNLECGRNFEIKIINYLLDKGYDITNVCRWDSGNKPGFDMPMSARAKMSTSKMGHAPTFTGTHSEYSKNKMLESAKHRNPVSEETRHRISVANKGKVRSEETRARMSKTSTGRKHSEETIRKMSKPRLSMKGKHYPKMSEAQKGNKKSLGHRHTDETKHKMSEAKMGHVNTDETRQKMSESNKGKHSGPKSDDTKRKMSESAKRRWEREHAK